MRSAEVARVIRAASSIWPSPSAGPCRIRFTRRAGAGSLSPPARAQGHAGSLASTRMRSGPTRRALLPAAHELDQPCAVERRVLHELQLHGLVGRVDARDAERPRREPHLWHSSSARAGSGSSAESIDQLLAQASSCSDDPGVGEALVEREPLLHVAAVARRASKRRHVEIYLGVEIEVLFRAPARGPTSKRAPRARACVRRSEKPLPGSRPTALRRAPRRRRGSRGRASPGKNRSRAPPSSGSPTRRFFACAPSASSGGVRR